MSPKASDLETRLLRYAAGLLMSITTFFVWKTYTKMDEIITAYPLMKQDIEMLKQARLSDKQAYNYLYGPRARKQDEITYDSLAR